MRKVAVIAPHPDDETLGCGGTLLKHIHSGDEVHWIIVTSMSPRFAVSDERRALRKQEIVQASKFYGFKGTYELGFPAAELSSEHLPTLIGSIGECFRNIEPETVYLPYRGDVHTDHVFVYDAVVSCTKWFRYPSISRVLAYETLSETDFGLNTDVNGFRPNVFIDIHPYLQKKLQAAAIFESEFHAFPFPRSMEAMEALAKVRGSASGFLAAEAFILLKEMIR